MAEQNKYLIFLGCAIPYRVAAYEISARKVLPKLGVELVEMPEFNCCGLPMDPVDHEMMVIMAARNIALAEQQGLNILTLCPGCSGTLRKVNKMLKEDKNLREEINRLHAQTCSALADPIRILLLYTLNEKPHNVTELTEILNLPQSTVSRHLKILRDRRMVIRKREGQTVIYSLTDNRTIQALDLLRTILAESLESQGELAKSVNPTITD